MGKKLLYILGLFFFAGTVQAQDTFDAKKRSAQTASKTLINPKFDVSGLKVKPRPAVVAKGRSTYRMPSIFRANGGASLYIHKSIRTADTGIPLFMESEATDAAKTLASAQSIENIGMHYLQDIAHLLRIKDPTAEFYTTSKKTDALGQTHLKMQQTFMGVKVYGGEVVVHLDKRRQVHAFNGRNRPTPYLESVVPNISFETALAHIEGDLGIKLPRSQAVKSGLGALLTVPQPKEELVIYPIGGKELLTRHITVFPNMIDRWEYFIDAQTGAVLDKFYHTCTLHHGLGDKHDSHNQVMVTSPLPPATGSGRDVNGVTRQLDTWSSGGTNYLVDATKPMFNTANSQMPDNPVGGIMTLDLRNEAAVEGVQIFHVTANGSSFNNANGVSAHYNADVSYEYFRTTFNRNSINGQGGTIISFINVADPDTGGGMDNAYWNGNAMFYGNGDRGFTPLAGGLDVGGHEMAHGVIQNTANLEYRYQSGAINESFADIFAAMIDRDDWLIGEDIVNRNVFTSGAMRNMENPNNGASGFGQIGWQPKDMTEFYTGDQNNGGVHTNSGIPNRAFYLFATSIGKASAEQIYYRALDTYLTASSQFIDLRLAVVRSATDLHGDSSPEVRAAETAFDTVGITDGEATDVDNDIPVAEGDEFILSLDVRSSDPNTLYVSDTNGNNFVPITTTRVGRKPSISDDGSFAIFVTEENTVNGVSLDKDNPEEIVISDEPIWAAVSLSKDGTKLAAIANNEENIIFVSDLISGEAFAFELFNPTTSDANLTTGEVLYPDALEWDYSGEYLIYDALNRINNAQGTDIEYWDVGVLKVWDNQANTFGDGSIQKLFANLPDGVSIGNPSLAKTSGNILAFDYLDELNDIYEVITANIETGEVRTVYENNKLGFPNYSKNDDKLIFDSFNNGDEVIGVIDLAADRLSPSGNATELIPDAKWGIWYTVGTRSILSSEKELTDFRFNVTNPASVGVFNGSQITVAIPNNINPQNLVATFSHSAQSRVSIGNTAQQSGVNSNDFTNAVIYTVTAQDGSTKNFTVTLGSGAIVTPNDSDGDGVPNDVDQCPNTPNGAVVNLQGCPTFSLPATNYRIASIGESCVDSNNGSITITAQQNLNYTARLSGNGGSQSVSFNNTQTFGNLSSGTYTLCFTVQGEIGYEQCYDVMVVEPEALSVSGKMNLTDKSVTLALQGADRYSIYVNDTFYTTTEAEIKIALTAAINTVKVTTDKDCQGSYEASFILEEDISVFPNPVSDGRLQVSIPGALQGSCTLQLVTLEGQTVYTDDKRVSSNSLPLDVGHISNGVYLLYVTMQGRTTAHKIIIN